MKRQWKISYAIFTSPFFKCWLVFVLLCAQSTHVLYTDKKENKIFLIYKEIQSGAVAKLYLRKGFLIYEEMHKYFSIYEEADSHVWLCNCSTLNFLIYEENVLFFFISVTVIRKHPNFSTGIFLRWPLSYWSRCSSLIQGQKSIESTALKN